METEYIEFSDHSSLIEIDEKNLTIKQKYPWLSNTTMKIKNINLKLHNEIIDFYNYVKPKKIDIEKRNLAVKELEAIIKNKFNSFELHIFGSFKTKLFLKNSDLDICIINYEYTSKKLWFKICKIVKNYDRYKNILTLPNAKVPILKFFDDENKINIDIVFNVKDGIKILKPMIKIIKKFKQMKYIIILMKYFLKIRNFNETYKGGIGSFLLYNMIRWFFKSYLAIYLKKNDYKLNKICDISLSQLFLQFLEFYTVSFDYKNYEIHMTNIPQIKIKKENQDSFFTLYSPQDENHNLGSSAYNFQNIIEILKNRYMILKNKDWSEDSSILKYFFNPNEEFFTLNI